MALHTFSPFFSALGTPIFSTLLLCHASSCGLTSTIPNLLHISRHPLCSLYPSPAHNPKLYTEHHLYLTNFFLHMVGSFGWWLYDIPITAICFLTSDHLNRDFFWFFIFFYFFRLFFSLYNLSNVYFSLQSVSLHFPWMLWVKVVCGCVAYPHTGGYELMD